MKARDAHGKRAAPWSNEVGGGAWTGGGRPTANYRAPLDLPAGPSD